MATTEIFVFYVQLDDIAPPIWRRLELRRDRTFWHLHCAIQDAMPWQDKHLHEFEFSAGDTMSRIGLPSDEFPGEREILPGWKTPLAEWFVTAPSQCRYWYDFGDDWFHTVTLEAIRPAEQGRRYPRCPAGERRCPPEDVGGPHGYQVFLEAMSDPAHEEHQACREWIGYDWDPEWFRPGDVRFASPERLLREYGLV